MIISGKIVSGVCAASKPGGLPTFMPHFERQYDEFRGAHPATINVDVGQPVDLKIDFRTWQFEFMGCILFCEFVRVLFEYPSGQTYKAWVYQPYGYHRVELKKESFLEI